jgi:hypothetical protein
MVPDRVKLYVLESIEGTPIVLRSLLSRLPDDSSFWDSRPEPDRFTLREVIAHLADWDEVFFARIERTVNEDNPTLEIIDPEKLAVENNYSAQDVSSSFVRFRKNRSKLAAYLKELPVSSYSRNAERVDIGPLSVWTQIVMILGHDGYHTKQAAEYIDAALD